jgi:allophanate hydrolase subunit 2
VVPGPDLDRFTERALEWLSSSTFRISARSDRVGARLEGPTLPREPSDVAGSGAMLSGAIQMPPSGEPVVLGPDHPTVGGYPVLATVVRRDLGAVMARPAGAEIRFVIA